MTVLRILTDLMNKLAAGTVSSFWVLSEQLQYTVHWLSAPACFSTRQTSHNVSFVFVTLANETCLFRQTTKHYNASKSNATHKHMHAEDPTRTRFSKRSQHRMGCFWSWMDDVMWKEKERAGFKNQGPLVTLLVLNQRSRGHQLVSWFIGLLVGINAYLLFPLLHAIATTRSTQQRKGNSWLHQRHDCSACTLLNCNLQACTQLLVDVQSSGSRNSAHLVLYFLLNFLNTGSEAYPAARRVLEKERQGRVETNWICRSTNHASFR